MKTLLLTTLFTFVAIAQADDLIYQDSFDTVPCESRAIPDGYTVFEAPYTRYNDLAPFGTSTHVSFELPINITRIMALQPFRFPDGLQRRRIVFEQAPTNYNLMGDATVSISKCAGDFTQNAECVMPVNSFSTIFLSTVPSDNPEHYCILNSGEEYFINYILSPDPFNEASSCFDPTDFTCTVFYSESTL